MPALLAYFYISNSYIMGLAVFVIVFSLYAQIRVSSAYSKNSQVGSRGGMSGRDAAAAVMARAGITGVEITETQGRLTDHYDPANKRLVLSSDNYHGTSLAAVGVSAHEAGHALQHQEGYSMLEFRMSLVPVTRIAAGIAPFIYIGLMFFSRSVAGPLLNVAIVVFAVLTVFQLITLPVEYDASRRAKAQLVSLGILDQDEMHGVNQVLDAAALTYLAAFMGAALNLLSVLSRRN
ncbi:MAG TPA: zinc metallopeptidase [Opitutaceae bacterium]|nr:zinc metallopeptidase [Opitutaceae bacterium]